jgi:hypothetical protein
MLGGDVISVAILQLDGEVLRGIRVSSTRMPGLVSSARKLDVSGTLGTPGGCDSREEWATYFQAGVPFTRPNAMGRESLLAYVMTACSADGVLLRGLVKLTPLASLMFPMAYAVGDAPGQQVANDR